MTTKHFLTSLFVVLMTTLVGQPTPIFSQDRMDDETLERLTFYIPVFTAPNCPEFLTNFGSSRKSVDHYAQTIGLEELTTLQIPKGQMAGLDDVDLYVVIYSEPGNIMAKDGTYVSENIYYNFVFTPDHKYIGIGCYFEFRSNSIAQSFQRSLLERMGMLRYQELASTLLECEAPGKETIRIVSSQVSHNNVAYTVFDYNMVNGLIEKSKKSKKGKI